MTGVSLGEEPIVTLWRAGRLPIEDGLYLANGTSYAVEMDPEAPGGLRVVEEFDLAELLAEDPEWVTSIDITGETEIPGGAGYLCRGEGSYGSEGFFARLGSDRELVWVVYLEESNPFAETVLTGTAATLTSTSGVGITVDIDNPVPAAPGTR